MANLTFSEMLASLDMRPVVRDYFMDSMQYALAPGRLRYVSTGRRFGRTTAVRNHIREIGDKFRRIYGPIRFHGTLPDTEDEFHRLISDELRHGMERVYEEAMRRGNGVANVRVESNPPRMVADVVEVDEMSSNSRTAEWIRDLERLHREAQMTDVQAGREMTPEEISADLVGLTNTQIRYRLRNLSTERLNELERHLMRLEGWVREHGIVHEMLGERNGGRNTVENNVERGVYSRSFAPEPRSIESYPEEDQGFVRMVREWDSARLQREWDTIDRYTAEGQVRIREEYERRFGGSSRPGPYPEPGNVVTGVDHEAGTVTLGSSRRPLRRFEDAVDSIHIPQHLQQDLSRLHRPGAQEPIVAYFDEEAPAPDHSGEPPIEKCILISRGGWQKTAQLASYPPRLEVPSMPEIASPPPEVSNAEAWIASTSFRHKETKEYCNPRTKRRFITRYYEEV